MTFSTRNAKVITLDTDGPRYQSLLASAVAAGVTLEPVPAYDARGVVFGTPEAEALRARVVQVDPGETWGAIGCTLSHLGIYETLTDTTVILEDDAVLTEGFDWSNLIAMVDESPYDLVFLHHHSHFGPSFAARPEGLHRMPLRGQKVATCGYVIKATAAASIISTLRRNDDGEVVAPNIIDRMLARLRLMGYHLGIIKPYPIIHSGIESTVEDASYISGKAPVILPPTVIIPRQITAWQAKAVLALTPTSEEGVTLLDSANAAIEAMPEGPDKVLVKSAWAYNANFKRRSPTIVAFGQALGLDDAALDELFRQGAMLDV
jgi:hypothetical protein